MKDWLVGHLAYPRETFNIAWGLRFRNENAVQAVNLKGERPIGRALQHVTFMVAFGLLSVELGLYIITGDTLPVPSLLVQITIELLVLTLAVCLAVSTRVVLRRLKGLSVAWGPLLACAVYVFLSYTLWVVIAVLVLSILVEDISPTLARGVRSVLIADTGSLFVFLLKKNGIIPNEDLGLLAGVGIYVIAVLFWIPSLTGAVAVYFVLLK